jgi:hypothetical protein
MDLFRPTPRLSALALPPPLLPVDRALDAPLGTPRRFYQILEQPAPFAGCEFPYGFENWSRLADLGFRRVVCLASETPGYNPAPLRLLHACELDDLGVIQTPDEPIEEARQIRLIARRIALALVAGEGVLVHCAAGRGRTGTVIGVALRFLGMPASEVIAYLDHLHRERSGRGWPESPWQSRLIERTKPQMRNPCSWNEK